MGKHPIGRLIGGQEGAFDRFDHGQEDILKRRQYPIAAKDEHGRLLVAAAIGAAGTYLERARALVDAGVDALVVDTAHGHSQGVLDATAINREKFPNCSAHIAGNIAKACRGGGARGAAVDGVKAGVGLAHLYHAQ